MADSQADRGRTEKMAAGCAAPAESVIPKSEGAHHDAGGKNRSSQDLLLAEEEGDGRWQPVDKCIQPTSRRLSHCVSRQPVPQDRTCQPLPAAGAADKPQPRHAGQLFGPAGQRSNPARWHAWSTAQNRPDSTQAPRPVRIGQHRPGLPALACADRCSVLYFPLPGCLALVMRFTQVRGNDSHHKHFNLRFWSDHARLEKLPAQFDAFCTADESMNRPGRPSKQGRRSHHRPGPE